MEIGRDALTERPIGIYRICLHRALSSQVRTGSVVQIALELASEFRDEFANLSILRLCLFDIEFLSISKNEIVYSSSKAIKISKSRYLFEVCFPMDVGPHKLSVRGVCRDECIVLVPMESETFEIVDVAVDTVSVLLAAHWRYEVSSHSKGASSYVVIREEFGSTLGSHVWDSAVVLARHMSKCLDACVPVNRRLAVELGAGCGLAGIALAHESFERVVLTDMQCNVPYMRKNIELNNCSDVVTADSLNWAYYEEIRHFMATHKSTEIDLIIAADVLYDIAAATCLFELLRMMCTPNTTSIIICQKLRPLSDRCSRFDLQLLPDFGCTMILEEAKVIIWKLIFLG